MKIMNIKDTRFQNGINTKKMIFIFQSLIWMKFKVFIANHIVQNVKYGYQTTLKHSILINI